MSPDAYLVAAWSPFTSASIQPWVPPGLKLAYGGPGLSVWVSSRTPHLGVTAISPSRVLIGETYRSDPCSGQAADPFDLTNLEALSLESICQRLISCGWGRYILIDHTPHATAALRDPSGALDCLTWRNASVRFFAARLPRDLALLLPTSVSIDWTAVSRQLREPPAISGASAVRNIDAVAPGALWVEEAGGAAEARQFWRPVEIARRGRVPAGDPAQALRGQVKTCVATLAQRHQRLVAEISGGLDSAIVAAVLTDAAKEPSSDIRWINFATEDFEGDERSYARAIAHQLGIVLTERPRTPLRYAVSGLAGVGSDFRVGLTALDPDYDLDLVKQALDHRAEALVTGQGGDVVFQQMATTDALADRLRLRGRMDISELLAHSRRWHRSLWGTLGTVIGRAAWPSPRRTPDRAYLTDSSQSAALTHPWLADLQGLAPAKAAQIQALVATQNVFGPSRRSEVICCLHPLLSQPVVELALSLPSFELTRGGQDRALARAAFADRLPPVLRDRRSKGSMQAFYGRAVAASLDVLRPWLLDGVLAREGLIRIDRLEPLLDPDVLIMTDVYVEILHVAAIEAWAREWTERIAAIKRHPAAAALSDSPQEI